VPVIPVANLGKRAAEIAARFFGTPAAGLEVFAVTGTAGKTCVAHYCAQALGAEGLAAGLRCGVIGSLGCGFFDGSAAVSPAVTDAVAFHAELARLPRRAPPPSRWRCRRSRSISAASGRCIRATRCSPT
jgi:UDP-N-acetylmuramoyl-L-alanyl-D-glutamate--2,6-diaminopimelate ligase